MPRSDLHFRNKNLGLLLVFSASIVSLIFLANSHKSISPCWLSWGHPALGPACASLALPRGQRRKTGESACLLHMPSYCLVLIDAEARTLGWLQKETWKLTPSLILFRSSVQQSFCPPCWQCTLISAGGGKGCQLPSHQEMEVLI